MGKKDRDLNPFVTLAPKKKKSKKKKKKKAFSSDSDSDSSLSSAVEFGGLAKDGVDQKIFQNMFLERNTSKVVEGATVYDCFSDDEEIMEERKNRKGSVFKSDSSKKKKSKRDKKKSKKKKKKKDKKKKKSSKKKKRSGSSESENDSGSEDESKPATKIVQTPRLDLKTANMALINLLGEAEGMKEEISGMFGHIDSGEELDISGIQNEDIQTYLLAFFGAMLFEPGKEGGWQAGFNTPKLVPMFGPNIQRYQFKKPIPKKPKQQPVATQSTLSASMAPPPPRSVPEDTSSSSSSGIGEKKVVRRAGPAMPSMADLEEAKRLAEEKAWEKDDVDEEDVLDSDNEEDLGPLRPGEGPAHKQRALQQLRMVREMAALKKKESNLKPKHEDWMTVIPEEQKLDAKVDERGRKFSMKGVKKRGDTSEWTMTPEERARKKAEQLLVGTSENDKVKRSKLKLKEKAARKRAAAMAEPAVTQGESLLSAHQNKRKKTQKKQVGGTFNFSFRGMREDRQYNKKEADKMHNAGKKLTMGFSTGELYKSQI